MLLPRTSINKIMPFLPQSKPSTKAQAGKFFFSYLNVPTCFNVLQVSKDFNTFILTTESLFTENERLVPTPSPPSTFPPDLLSIRKRLAQPKADKFHLFFGIDLILHFFSSFSFCGIIFLTSLYFQTLYKHSFSPILTCVLTSQLFVSFGLVFSLFRDINAFSKMTKLNESFFGIFYVLSLFSFFEISIFDTFSLFFLLLCNTFIVDFSFEIESSGLEGGTSWNRATRWKRLKEQSWIFIVSIGCRFVGEYPFFSFFISQFALSFYHGVTAVFEEARGCNVLYVSPFFIFFLFLNFYFSSLHEQTQNIQAYVIWAISSIFTIYSGFSFIVLAQDHLKNAIQVKSVRENIEKFFWIFEIFFKLFFYYYFLKTICYFVLCLTIL